MTARLAATARWESDVGEARARAATTALLELPTLEAGAAVGAELGRGVDDRGEGTQHQEFALGQGVSPLRMWKSPKQNSVRNRGSASLNGSGRSAKLSLISFPYSGACSARRVHHGPAQVSQHHQIGVATGVTGFRWPHDIS